MEYSFLLGVANFPIQFYCKKKADSSFFRKKYGDFLIKKGDANKPVCKIFFIKHHSRQIQVKGKNFYLPVLPLKKNFRLFNDLLRIVLIYVLNRNNGFILHASVLVENRLGYIFVGKEDTGKSTIRKLFPELVCLGDDTAIIRKIRRRFFLFGSPFYQRTNRAYPNQKVLIRAVFELKKADFNLVKLLSFPENLKSLSSNTYIANIGKKSEEKELLLKNYSDFCLKNKTFSLYFKKDRSFWPLLEQSISENLTRQRINKITKLINPRVLKKLPKGIIWFPAVASWEFLKDCLVINEASWNFEFNGQRRVKRIAKFIIQPTIFSPHTELINKIKQQMGEKADKQWITLIEKDNVFTIIDGNHLAIAAYQLGRLGKEINLRLLIGNLPQGKICPWC